MSKSPKSNRSKSRRTTPWDELAHPTPVQRFIKRSRNYPLTEEQKKSNRQKSKIRCRIEHIFGFMTNSMNGINIRCIGIDRAWFNIGLMNLVYNLCRYEFLKRASA